MMFPAGGKVVCKKCGYEKEQGADPALISKSKRDDREVTILEENFDEGLPTTAARCPECGHNLAYWWLRQLRSADESETRFFKCTKCGATWREYD
jgi:DNA-directed RNA polymerase subunit M